MQSSRTFTSRLAPAILLALSVLLLQIPAWPSPAQDKEEKKKVFIDEDEKVEPIPGRWRLALGLDMQQASDYSVPVFVRGINMSSGQGRYAGRVKVTEAELENRVQKTTRSIQLRWAIVMHEEPDTVLLEGLMPFMEVQIEANGAPLRVDIPHIYFNKIVRPLLKEGEISGHLRLVVGVQEVRFIDGATWRRSQQSAFLRPSSSGPPFTLRRRYLKPALSIDLLRWRSLQPPTSTPCEEQPRLFASAVLFTPSQVTDPPLP
jgi:hypothetical protein